MALDLQADRTSKGWSTTEARSENAKIDIVNKGVENLYTGGTVTGS